MRKFYSVKPTNIMSISSRVAAFLTIAQTGMIVVIYLIACISLSAQTKLTAYVDPFIGTAGHGHTYPGASLPHGLVQLSPDTDTDGWDWCSGYHYSDSSIMGFSHTHLSGTGCADYGDILFMPTTGELKTEPGDKNKPGSGYRSRFSHKNEAAHPGYYSVILDDYNVNAELTATCRAGFHKYMFPQTDKANIIIDLVHGIQDKVIDSQIKIIGNKIIEGYRRSSGWAKDHTVYFYAEFSKPFKTSGVVENGKIPEGKDSAQGKAVKAFVRYAANSGEIVYIKVGISHTNLEGARKNLAAEIPGWNFNGIKKKAEAAWEKELSKVAVESKNQNYITTFYTALYHALLNPNIMSDVDGSCIGMDKNIHSFGHHKMYTVFSLWDTFRAEHPLFTLIEKNEDGDMVRSLIAKYDESGLLPVWELASNETGTMIGYHAIPVIVDAYFKGIRDFDVQKAYEAMKKSAMQDKDGLKYYKEMGYIPSNLENESVSKTLEYAYDDWCIAQMAKDLGKYDDYKYFSERAKFYSNVFDPSTRLMRAKKNGRWYEPFDPYAVSGNYTEANAWQYSFFVPHDVDGLIKLMGGNKNFVSKLDELFTAKPDLTGRFQSDITGMIGQYAQGNEPSHHMAYLYNYAGEPWKTQEKIHEILTTLYTDKVDGLCGNEDCGQMSAWYVLSAIGFYPVCPGDGKYIFGTPLFDKVTINTGGKKNFTVLVKNLSDKSLPARFDDASARRAGHASFYVKSVKLNGKNYPYSYIRHSDIVKGGNLVFVMGSQPSRWGSDTAARPTSRIEVPFVTVSYLSSGERVFREPFKVSISAIDSLSVIYFTTDGTDPVKSRQVYSAPIQIDSTTTLKAVCFNNGNFSKVVTAIFNKLPEGRTIKLNTKYNPHYTGGGELGLIDGIRGSSNFHTDAWQGYEGNDLDAVIDLGKVQAVSLISASFLQNIGAWIFFPALIEYYVSNDGKNFTRVYETENIPDEKNSRDGIKNFDKKLDGIEAKYIRVYAKNLGVCPPWHIATGGKAWLFTDEITIKRLYYKKILFIIDAVI